jgi:hypothetical protein
VTGDTHQGALHTETEFTRSQRSSHSTAIPASHSSFRQLHLLLFPALPPILLFNFYGSPTLPLALLEGLRPYSAYSLAVIPNSAMPVCLCLSPWFPTYLISLIFPSYVLLFLLHSYSVYSLVSTAFSACSSVPIFNSASSSARLNSAAPFGFLLLPPYGTICYQHRLEGSYKYWTPLPCTPPSLTPPQ